VSSTTVDSCEDEVKKGNGVGTVCFGVASGSGLQKGAAFVRTTPENAFQIRNGESKHGEQRLNFLENADRKSEPSDFIDLTSLQNCKTTPEKTLRRVDKAQKLRAVRGGKKPVVVRRRSSSNSKLTALLARNKLREQQLKIKHQTRNSKADTRQEVSPESLQALLFEFVPLSPVCSIISEYFMIFNGVQVFQHTCIVLAFSPTLLRPSVK
jgi:hypothetical protein